MFIIQHLYHENQSEESRRGNEKVCSAPRMQDSAAALDWGDVKDSLSLRSDTWNRRKGMPRRGNALTFYGLVTHPKFMKTPTGDCLALENHVL
jgi:hypothetical protein